MLKRQKEQGFTLIELLLVVVIIGILLAVIVPRAWRANIDSKYGLVRQNASELASFGSLWAEQQIEAANESLSTSTMFHYLETLTDMNTSSSGDEGVGTIGWVAEDSDTNWWHRNRGDSEDPDTDGLPGITGRMISADDEDRAPENSVEAIVPAEKIPRNPFNGVSVFQTTNHPPSAATAVPGALACGWNKDDASEGNWAYFAFIFQGTDSEGVKSNSTEAFLAGQDSTLQGLRNGIFFARTPYYVDE